MKSFDVLTQALSGCCRHVNDGSRSPFRSNLDPGEVPPTPSDSSAMAAIARYEHLFAPFEPRAQIIKGGTSVFGGSDSILSWDNAPCSHSEIGSDNPCSRQLSGSRRKMRAKWLIHRPLSAAAFHTTEFSKNSVAVVPLNCIPIVKAA
jgi:hypothetical protein